MIKDTMKRLKPSFNETYHGYSTFSALLEDAQQLGLLELETDDRSGTYVVARFGDELTSPAAEAGESRGRRRGRSRSRTGGLPRERDPRAESSPEEPLLDRGAPPENAPTDDRDSRRPRPRRRPGSRPRPDTPIDPKLPPETFDEEFLPWPEE
jgi:hypothetical protein